MFFSANKLTGGYGGVNIIEDCSFNVNQGEIVSILGPNGAGKSTAMKAMLGILNLNEGNIFFDGHDITKLKTQDRIKLGISFDLLKDYQLFHFLNVLFLKIVIPQ